VDFGVAKLTNTGHRRRRTIRRWARSSARRPTCRRSNCAAKPVDARADVFSLGVMAYEMLTARKPYTGASLFDIGMQQVEGKVDLSGIDPRSPCDSPAIAYEKEKRPAAPWRSRRAEAARSY
jgi:serine/threonine protein kinase